MLKFEVNGKLGKKVITLPTMLSEITPEYLKDVAENIKVADNYSLIALCHKERLSAFVMAGRSNKNNMSTAVVPLFVKTGKTDNDFICSVNTADKLLLTPADMATGLHVNVPLNTLTMGNFMKYIDGDGHAYQNAAKHTDDVYFLEFKIVPNCAIQGVYGKRVGTFSNPFDIVDAIDGEV